MNKQLAILIRNKVVEIPPLFYYASVPYSDKEIKELEKQKKPIYIRRKQYSINHEKAIKNRLESILKINKKLITNQQRVFAVMVLIEERKQQVTRFLEYIEQQKIAKEQIEATAFGNFIEENNIELKQLEANVQTEIVEPLQIINDVTRNDG